MPHQAMRRLSDVAGGRGVPLVVGLLALGLAAAATGVWFQWRQTRRCLAFYGPAVARRISVAPRVELWTLRPGVGHGRLVAEEKLDVSGARGLVHLRRGLVEDANFRWDGPAPTGERLPDDAWDDAVAFFDGPDDSAAATILAIDLGADGGSLAVVGRPGRIGLGRIEGGLKRWIEATRRSQRSDRSAD
ncbi:MAG: hypothetical protein EBZ59_01765 [Planctomycetia bacterium]|nr:hypothetical protein [Planctomycetia bacterium]